MQYHSSIADHVLNIAVNAGDILMKHFNPQLKVAYKDDHSPITIADMESSRYIEQALGALTPDITVISEESDAKPEQLRRFWLVDPLDGTRAYVEGVPEFSVNIGLIENGRSIFGVLHVPAQHISYMGGVDMPAVKIHADNTRSNIRTRPPGDQWVVTKSASHPSKKLGEFLKPYPIGTFIPMSGAAKFGLIAEAAADMYPRLGPTMEWDTAAGQAIVEAAGGYMQTEDGQPFRYGKPGFLNPGFVVFGQKPQ